MGCFVQPTLNRCASCLNDCDNVSQKPPLKEEPTYTANLVVLVIVLGLLDHVPPHDVVVSVVIVLLVVDKVVLAQEFRLVILEFPDHLDGLLWVLLILASSGEVR